MNILNEMFTDNSTGISLSDTKNNMIINEAVIYDKLDGDIAKLKTVVESVGKYAARDGILTESCNLDTAVGTFCDMKCADSAAILASAKEAGSKDYDLYIKAIMLQKACMDRMKQSFGNIANQRVEAQKAEVEANPRIMTAINSCSEC